MHVYMFVLFNRSIGTVSNNTQSHIVGLNHDVTVSMWLTCLDNSTTLINGAEEAPKDWSALKFVYTLL